ncbi:hypothetical protein [Phyllobacterium sp. 628]
MLEHLFYELGSWNWVVLGFILLILEVAAPGIFCCGLVLPRLSSGF